MPHIALSAMLCFLVVAFTLGFTIPSMAQDETDSLQDSTRIEQDHESADRRLRCLKPANPHRLPFECVGKTFDAIKETLTQDWASYRTELAKAGITSTHSYTAQFMGNPIGGQSQGFTYAGTLEALLVWDLHKFLGLSGLSFNIGASYASGRNLSAEYIGNVFTVQSAFNGMGNVNLQQMYLQQQFLDNVFTVALGRLAPANLFATLPVFNNYLSVGINAVPGSLGINDITFASSPPGVEWGIQMTYNVTQTSQFAVGMYNTNPYAAAGNDNGINFAFQQGNTGVLPVAQASYLFNQAKEDTGLPGEYTIGGFYDSNNFSNLSNPANQSRGYYSLYAMFQQMVYRDGGAGSQKGLTVWGEVALSPKPSVGRLPYFFGWGLSYQGIMPSRGKDIASVGLTYGSFSGYLPQTANESIIETNYGITLKPWLSITPDFQYVMKPGGNSNVKNAVVLGAQLAITL